MSNILLLSSLISLMSMSMEGVRTLSFLISFLCPCFAFSHLFDHVPGPWTPELLGLGN